MIVIDASVAVKWFVREAGSPEAEALVTGGDIRAAPSHILSEVSQALLRHHHAGLLSLEYCRSSLARIGRLVRLTPAETFIESALGIAAGTRCSVYDALYLAAAERWKAAFIIADAKLINRVFGTPWRRLIQQLPTGL